MASVTDKALWIMERNSDCALTLNSIARACGVSRSHLAHAFGSATGQSVMRYLRARRLSRAAKQLASGAPDILTVAFDAGYGSHEAFTRAFREQFSVTPEQVRERKSLAGLPDTTPLLLSPTPWTTLSAPRFERQGNLRLVGYAEWHVFETTIDIPDQWQRFMAHYEAIPDKAQAIPLGLKNVPDDDGRFRYVCGAEVTAVTEIPAGLEPVDVEARDYVVFAHDEHVSTLYGAYAAIWNDVLPALSCEVADAPVLERHNSTFDPKTGEGGLTLWIPLAQPASPAAATRLGGIG